MKPRSFFNWAFLTLSLLFTINALGENRWSVYRHPQFTFTYPSNWRVENTQLTTTKAKLSADEKGHMANCAVFSSPLKESANLSQKQINQLFFGQKLKPFDVLEAMRVDTPDLQLIRWTESRVSNLPAFYGEIDYSLQILATKIHMHGLIVYVFRPGYEWKILCVGAGSTPNEAKVSFDYWNLTMQRIMGTFLFQPDGSP